MQKIPEEDLAVNIILSVKLSDGSLDSTIHIPIDCPIEDKVKAIHIWLNDMFDNLDKRESNQA